MSKLLKKVSLAAIFALVLAACGGGTNVRNAQSSLPAPDTSPAAAAYQNGSDYRVGAQDLLEISVFGVDDLSHSARVNSSGRITMPLVGSVMAGGKTIEELETEIAGKLRAGYLQDPHVSVFVKESTSQRITLEGSVTRPGIYPLAGKTTLLQAIAMAEGVTQLADLGGIVLFREIDGRRAAAVYDLRLVRSGQLEDPQVYGDDIIVVEQSGSKTAWRRVIESLPVLGVLTWF